MSIQWREEMAIDHGIIDSDHQTLISIINMFCDATPASDSLPKLQSILDMLQLYTEDHFEREESLQQKAHYAFIDAHHHEHIDLIRKLTTLRKRLTMLAENDPGASEGSDVDSRASGLPPEAPKVNVAVFHAEMAAFLHHWLIDHVVKSDLRMKPYAAKLNEHASKFSALVEPGRFLILPDC